MLPGNTGLLNFRGSYEPLLFWGDRPVSHRLAIWFTARLPRFLGSATMVPVEGVEPTFPLCKSGRLPLTYTGLVQAGNFEIPTTGLKDQRSASELTLAWSSFPESNWASPRYQRGVFYRLTQRGWWLLGCSNPYVFLFREVSYRLNETAVVLAE